MRRALVLLLALPLRFAFAQAAAPIQPVNQESLALPSLAPLVESVKASVVNVDVQSRGGPLHGGPGGGGEDPGEELFDFFFRGRRPRGGPRDQEPLRQGMGSGFIIDAGGLTLTNNHVVEGAVGIRVRLDDGRTFEAEVLGRDPLTDIALIKLKGKVENLPVVRLGDSDAIRVGDWALAIGNPFGLASSVSLGIISAKARNINAGPYDDFLQTDAAINPGNSGGPLFNMKGEVIGINTAIVGGGTGIGFAVPSNMVKSLLPQLEKEGGVTRGFLGIYVQSLTPDLAKALNVPVHDGAIVLDVSEGGPAKKAGLQKDDVIVQIDQTKITSGDVLTRTVALKRPGSVSTLVFYRAGKQRHAKVELATRPDIEKVGANEQKDSKDDEGSRQKVGLAFRDVQDLDPRMGQASGLPSEGALITQVSPGSAAERAELSRGMVVVEADRKPIRGAADLAKVIRNAKSGSTILLRVVAPGSNNAFLRALTIP